MTATSHGGAAAANISEFEGAGLGIQKTHGGFIHRVVTEQLRKLFPSKTWAHLAGILGISERVAKHRMAGSREFTAAELVQLLHTEDGFEYLVGFMADQQPKWWRLVVPLMQCADVQRMQIVAKRKLRKAVEGVLDADRDITTAIARADVLLDQDFMGAHSSALRSMARVPDRTVAPATKPRRR